MNFLLSTPTICYMSNGWITDQAEPQTIKIVILPLSLPIQGTVYFTCLLIICSLSYLIALKNYPSMTGRQLEKEKT